jgi:DNA mismatch repair Mlh1-like protein
MLREYFSLGITVEGMVESLPVLLPDFTPNLDKLPLFFMRLGPQVSLFSPPFSRRVLDTQSTAKGQLEQRTGVL